jgi:hypothetical protein
MTADESSRSGTKGGESILCVLRIPLLYQRSYNSEVRGVI